MKEIKRLTRCEKGHFYDAGKYDVCPHCEHTREIPVTKLETEWTQQRSDPDSVHPMFAPEADKAPVIESRGTWEQSAAPSVFSSEPAHSSARQDDSLTVHIYQKTLGTEPVVGWLVCVEGVHCGQDFRIKSGRNFVGRSGTMDVCLSGDMGVSRDRHLIVTYDPKSTLFFAQPGESSSALSYLNDKPLLEATELKSGDKLTVRPLLRQHLHMEEINQVYKT